MVSGRGKIDGCEDAMCKLRAVLHHAFQSVGIVCLATSSDLICQGQGVSAGDAQKRLRGAPARSSCVFDQHGTVGIVQLRKHR